MTKILRIINRFNLGGPTYNVSYLTKYLPESYETMLIGGPEEKGESSSLHITDSLGLKPLILKEMNREIDLKKDYRSYKEIKKIIQEFKPDIVHTHASKAGTIGRLAAISCGVPIIVHTFHGHVFHSYFGKMKTLFYKTIERYLAKRSAAIVAISDIQKKELVEKFKISSHEQTHVIPLGFDLKRFSENSTEKRDQFRNKFNLLPNTIAIGIIGRLAPIKNHELFIDSIISAASKTTQTIKAIIVGDGETKQQLKDYIRSQNANYSEGSDTSALFNFIGWQTEVDVVLNGLDLVALSSKNEGTPVSLIEAQASGKFIITTNVGGIKDILKPECGFIAENSKEFSDKLQKAITDFETLSTQAKSGIAFVNERFSYTRLANDMDILYQSLLKNKGIK